MSNWRPGKGFLAMVEQTKRDDMERRIRREFKDHGYMELRPGEDVGEQMDAGMRVVKEDDFDPTDLSVHVCKACGKAGAWHAAEDCPVAGPKIRAEEDQIQRRFVSSVFVLAARALQTQPCCGCNLSEPCAEHSPWNGMDTQDDQEDCFKVHKVYAPPSEHDVLFTEEGQVPFGSLCAFYDHLEKFDWCCAMCDTYGCAAADRARRDMDLMDKWSKLTGPAGELYQAYHKHMFTGGSFSNRGPKQPKPERPNAEGHYYGSDDQLYED